MQRVVRLLADELVRADAHQNVGGLDGDDEIIIAHVLDEVDLIERRLHDALGGDVTTVLRDQVLLEGAGVYADTDRDVPLLRAVHDGPDFLVRADVPRVDTDLIRAVFHRFDGHAVVEMDVGHERNRDLLLDLTNRQRGLVGRHSAADDLAAGLLEAVDLRDGRRDVLRLRVAHGLDCDRVLPADLYITDGNHTGLLSC